MTAASDLQDAQEEPSDLTDEEIAEIEQAEAQSVSISYSGTDFDVEGLVRRLNRGDIVVPNFGHPDSDLEVAGFQRSFVWRRPQMDRFIESLLLGYPIPAIMLVQQLDKRYLVLDGQQRLKTLQYFYDGVYRGVEFALTNVAEPFRGLTYKSLEDPLRRMLDNTFIQATIVRTDGSPASLDAVYQIFERLNSGGTQLTAHEIRIALYSGPLVGLLTDLNAVADWRKIYGPPSPRLRDQELVLRIIALYSRSNEYFSPLKRFLNTFMSDHRTLSTLPANEISHAFEVAASALNEAGVRDAIRRTGQRVNAALLEAVMVGYMRVLATGGRMPQSRLQAALLQIGKDPNLQLSSASSTTSEENVRARISGVTRIMTTEASTDAQ